MKKAILNTFTSRILSAVLNFVIVILLSQILGPEGKGEASLILTTIAMVIIFCDFVGGASLVYLIPRSNIIRLLITSYTWNILVCTITVLTLIIFPLLPSEFIPHIFFLCLIQSFTGVNHKVLVGKEKILILNIIRFGQVALTFTLLIFFFFGLQIQSTDAYIYSLYISFSAALIASCFAIYSHLQSENKDSYKVIIKNAFRYGFFNQLSHICQFLSFRISYFLIIHYWSEKTLGIYSNAASIAESIWLISSSISLVQYARITNSTNRAYNRDLTHRLIKLSIIFTCLAVFVLILIPPAFFQFIFGEEFGEVALIIRSLAPGIIFFNLALVVGHYFSGTGRYHYNTLASFVGLIITIIFGLILIPVFPLQGAALTASISYFITGMLITWLYLKEEKESFYKIIPVKSDYLYIINQIRSLWPGKKN